MKSNRVISAELPLGHGDRPLRVSLQAMPTGYRVTVTGPDYNQVVECATWSNATRWFHALLGAHNPHRRGGSGGRITPVAAPADGAVDLQ